MFDREIMKGFKDEMERVLATDEFQDKDALKVLLATAREMVLENDKDAPYCRWAVTRIQEQGELLFGATWNPDNKIH